jgi:PAS domain S-box-containing protein/putative nucleotidyltransferase with HDIG domain
MRKGSSKSATGNTTDTFNFTQSLLKNQKVVKNILNSLPGGVLIVDGRSNRVVDINSIAVKVIGAPKNSILGSHASDYLHPVKGSGSSGKKKLQGPQGQEYLLITNENQSVPIIKATSRVNLNGNSYLVESFTLAAKGHSVKKNTGPSGDMFRVIFENTPDAYYLSDAMGNFIDGNKAAEKLIGYTREELIGKNILKLHLLLPHQISKVTELLVKNSQGQVTGPDELTLKRKDRKLITVHIKTYPFTLDGTTYILGSIHDITSLKKKEQLLKDNKRLLEELVGERTIETKAVNEQLHREILEHKKTEKTLNETNIFLKSILDSSSSISIISTDTKGNILFWNKGAENIFGYGAEEAMKNLTINDLYPKDEDTKNVIKAIRYHIYDRKQEMSTKVKELTKDGRELWINLTACPRLDENGEVIGTLGIGEDITERKRAIEELSESEKKYSTIVEKGNDGIVIIQDGVLRFINPKMCEISGYSTKDALGKRFVELTAPEYARLVEEIYKKRVSGEDVQNKYEIELISKHKKRIAVEINASIVEFEGKPAYMAIVRDITERKKAEEDLQGSFKKLQKTFEGTIQTMAAIIETKDPYTAGHQRRVAELAQAIALEMGLSKQQAEGIRVGGLIHDVGKISIPAEILSKPGWLTGIEFNMIKTHTQVGYDILRPIEFPWPVAKIALQHHERLDGSGYPHGIVDDNILIEARVLSVADVVEAMATHRPYRPARGIDKALKEIANNSGKLYDPKVVSACLKLFHDNSYSFT